MRFSVPAAIFGLVATALAAPVDEVEKRDLDGQWACNIPNGYVYSAVRSVLNTCGGSGFSNYYRLATPRDNINACQVPTGYTYDWVKSELNACSTNGFANTYHIRAPGIDNVKACSVPWGMTYDWVKSELNACSANGFA